MNAHGYLFDKGKNEGTAEREATFNAIVEAFFTADHGTTLGYKKENGQVMPILDQWEYEALPWQEDYTKIRTVQEGAMAFIEDAIHNRSGAMVLRELDAMTAFRNWIQLGCYPSTICAKHFGNLHFLDDDTQPLVISQSVIKYLISPKQFARDFTKSAWRVGFFTRTFGAWPIQYWIYKWIRRFAHRVSE